MHTIDCPTDLHKLPCVLGEVRLHFPAWRDSESSFHRIVHLQSVVLGMLIYKDVRVRQRYLPQKMFEVHNRIVVGEELPVNG